MNFADNRNKFQVNFEYPSQMDEATMTHFLDAYSNHFPDVAQEHSQQQSSLSAQNADQQGDDRKQCTKTSNRSLPPESINTSEPGASAC
jgi:hypothetical protein